MNLSSVIEFITDDPKKDVKHFPECDDTKEKNYYVFERKVESFTKMVKLQSIHKQLVLIEKTRFGIL